MIARILLLVFAASVLLTVPAEIAFAGPCGEMKYAERADGAPQAEDQATPPADPLAPEPTNPACRSVALAGSWAAAVAAALGTLATLTMRFMSGRVSDLLAATAPRSGPPSSVLPPPRPQARAGRIGSTGGSGRAATTGGTESSDVVRGALDALNELSMRRDSVVAVAQSLQRATAQVAALTTLANGASQATATHPAGDGRPDASRRAAGRAKAMATGAAGRARQHAGQVRQLADRLPRLASELTWLPSVENRSVDVTPVSRKFAQITAMAHDLASLASHAASAASDSANALHTQTHAIASPAVVAAASAARLADTATEAFSKLLDDLISVVIDRLHRVPDFGEGLGKAGDLGPKLSKGVENSLKIAQKPTKMVPTSPRTGGATPEAHAGTAPTGPTVQNYEPPAPLNADATLAVFVLVLLAERAATMTAPRLAKLGTLCRRLVRVEPRTAINPIRKSGDGNR